MKDYLYKCKALFDKDYLGFLSAVGKTLVLPSLTAQYFPTIKKNNRLQYEFV